MTSRDKYPGRLTSLLDGILPCALDEGAADLPYSKYRLAVQKNQDSLARKLTKRGYQSAEKVTYFDASGKRVGVKRVRSARHHLVRSGMSTSIPADFGFLRDWARKLNAAMRGDEKKYVITTPSPYGDVIARGSSGPLDKSGMARAFGMHIVMPELPVRR